MNAVDFLNVMMGQDCWNAVLPVSFCLIPLPFYRKWLIFALMIALVGELWSTFKGFFAGPLPNVMGLWMFLVNAFFWCAFIYFGFRFLFWLIDEIWGFISSFKKDETPQRYRPFPPESQWAQYDHPTRMKWNNDKRSSVMYYFMDFYVSAKHWTSQTSRVTQHFNEEVNRFKDWGNETMWYSYLQGILSLKYNDLLIIFMPCATKERYMKRWEGLATYLHEYGFEVGLDMVEIVESRDISHFKPGSERYTSHNYELHIPKDKVCVILDDVRTTGRSINELTRSIRAQGSEVIGAIVMAQVPLGQIPYEVPEVNQSWEI